MSENNNKPLIIQPNMPKVVQAQVMHANIGGVKVDYQPDPALAVTVDAVVLQNPNALLGLLSAIINVQHATVRELLETREQIKGMGSELIALREEVTRATEGVGIVPSTPVDGAVDKQAPEASTEVG